MSFFKIFSFQRQNLNGFTAWCVMGWVWVGLVWYLSLTSRPPDLDIGLSLNDKLGHFIAYAWLMLWFGNVYRGYQARVVYALIFILMGIGLEFLQSLGSRQFDYYDMLANFIGVMIGFFILFTPFSKSFVWIERRIFGISR